MKLKDLFKFGVNVSVDSAKATAKALLLKALLYIVVLIVIIVSLIKLVNYGSSRYACHTQWVESSIEYKYTLRGGCLLKMEDGWVPAKNYRIQ